MRTSAKNLCFLATKVLENINKKADLMNYPLETDTWKNNFKKKKKKKTEILSHCLKCLYALEKNCIFRVRIFHFVWIFEDFEPKIRIFEES